MSPSGDGEAYWNKDAVSVLFLSCDLVGSTSYKQQAAGDGRWPEIFLAFYREYPQALVESARDKEVEADFRLWKVVGDELIFTVPVRSEQDVADAVDVWLEAMLRFERGVFDKVSPVQKRLGTRGGAFIGTFPGPDSHVFVPLRPEHERSDRGPVELNDLARTAYSPDRYVFDYLGPSIDTGFRVVSAGDHRFFTMTTEVAWAISRYRHNLDETAGDLVLLGSRLLRGVWDGREYPVFAIDRDYNDAVNSALRGMTPDSDTHDAIQQLCEACAVSKGWPSRLYLPDSTYYAFTVEPEDALAALRLNDMEGSETLAIADVTNAEALEQDTPLS